MKHFKQYIRIYFLLGLLLLNVIIYSAILYQNDSDMTVAFLDVGQGDAIFIKAPNGRQMLVDGGPGPIVLRELGKVMPFYDRSIDVVLATHADQDHVGGLVSVLQRFKVDLFVRTNTVSDSAAFNELLTLVEEKKIPTEIIVAPEDILLSADVEFGILFPVTDTAGWETNDSSIVGKVVYGNNSFLLTGDSPQLIEKYLVGKYGAQLKSDVLKAGHHGSKTSSSELFVGTVAPKYSIISAGKDNRYGHPSQEVLDVLKKFGGQILHTLGGGMIVFKSDGTNLVLNK